MNPAGTGYADTTWPAEDGGPTRRAVVRGDAAATFAPGTAVTTTFRPAPAATMPVWCGDRLFVLGHSVGERTHAWVEELDPHSLATRQTSTELAGGRTWPGGIAAHADGALHVVYGNHAHRLRPDDLGVEASAELPRDRPYNSFVVLADGHLVTKDFGGALPAADAPDEGCEVLVLDPVELGVVARVTLPEASVARLSADPDTGDVYVVGTHTLFRLHWDGSALTRDDGFAARYRTLDGQTHGWDAVLSLGAAWFLDNGAGAERYNGSMRGRGVSPAPLHLVRVDLATGDVALTEVCGLPNGMVANPPVIDVDRRIAVAYDSSNAQLAAFAIGADDVALTPIWRHEQAHGCHMLLLADAGAIVTNDHDAARFCDQWVVRDIVTGDERVRADTGGPFQSVLFSAPGRSRDVYLCSFAGIARLAEG